MRLVLRNDIGVIAETLPELQAFARTHGLSPKAANRLEVVFEELVSNTIRHGLSPSAEAQLQAGLEINRDVVRLTVEDDGRPFDPTTRPRPQPLSDLARTPSGGLGIELVRRLASRFAYERLGAPLVNRVVVELPIDKA